jgi:hypothetical protein
MYRVPCVIFPDFARTPLRHLIKVREAALATWLDMIADSDILPEQKEKLLDFPSAYRRPDNQAYVRAARSGS